MTPKHPAGGNGAGFILDVGCICPKTAKGVWCEAGSQLSGSAGQENVFHSTCWGEVPQGKGVGFQEAYGNSIRGSNGSGPGTERRKEVVRKQEMSSLRS